MPPDPTSTSRIPKFAGVLCFAWGLFGIFGALFPSLLAKSAGGGNAALSVLLDLSPSYLAYTTISGFAFSALLLVIGYFLVGYRRIGLRLFNIYAVCSIVLGVVDAVYLHRRGMPVFDRLDMTDPESAELFRQFVGGLGGGLGSLALPILGMVFLNRREIRDALR